MKKVCYVVTIPGTIEAFFIPQLQYLVDHGFDVTVVCSPSETLQKMLGSSIRFVPIHIARGISATSLYGSIWTLIKLFKKEQFDIVQYSTPNAAFCAAVASRYAKIKIRNYHMMGLRYLGMTGAMRFLFKQIEKITCGLSTHIEYITPSNLELSIQEGLFPREKATIVGKGSTGGVDINRFDYKNRTQWRNKIRAELKIPENDFVFGFVGRITRDKGINEILKAFSCVRNQCKLLMIGPQEGLNTIDSELWKDAMNDTNIIIHDSVRNIEHYYAAIDILLLPSYREGFGMVVAEAGAVGTPAIVSNIPGPIDVIEEGKTALTVKAKDSNDLVEKMHMCIDNRKLVKEMSDYAPIFIRENYDSEALCEKIYERKLFLLQCVK